MPMPEPREVEADKDWQSLYAAAEPLIRQVQLRTIRTTRAEAELLDDSAAEDISVEETISTAEVQASRLSPERLGFRVSYEDAFTDAGGNDAARVAVELLVVFSIPEDMEPTQDQVEGFAATTVARIVQPFYREAVSSLLARIGIRGLTVGLMRFPAADLARTPAENQG